MRLQNLAMMIMWRNYNCNNYRYNLITFVIKNYPTMSIHAKYAHVQHQHNNILFYKHFILILTVTSSKNEVYDNYKRKETTPQTQYSVIIIIWLQSSITSSSSVQFGATMWPSVQDTTKPPTQHVNLYHHLTSLTSHTQRHHQTTLLQYSHAHIKAFVVTALPTQHRNAAQ